MRARIERFRYAHRTCTVPREAAASDTNHSLPVQYPFEYMRTIDPGFTIGSSGFKRSLSAWQVVQQKSLSPNHNKIHSCLRTYASQSYTKLVKYQDCDGNMSFVVFLYLFVLSEIP